MREWILQVRVAVGAGLISEREVTAAWRRNLESSAQRVEETRAIARLS